MSRPKLSNASAHCERGDEHGPSFDGVPLASLPVSSPPLGSLPSRDEAHLYLLHVADFTDAIASRVLPLLSAEERARYDRMSFERVRTEYLATRALARITLGTYLDEDPRVLRFASNSYGRPALIDKGSPEVHFNLTNTQGLVGCLVGSHEEVGVDAEALDRRSRTVEVADRFFSPAEVAALRRTKGEEQQFTFFRFWTLKEAYIKARGMGLALPLSQFAFALDEDRIRISFGKRIDDDGATWRFSHVYASDAHLVSTAVRATGCGEVRIDVRRVAPEADWLPLLERYEGR